MLAMTLDELESILATADPKTIFGADRDGFLKRVRVACHPDRFPPGSPDAERADRLRKQAEALGSDIDRPTVVKSPKRVYRLCRRIGVGDAADVYMGECDGKPYVVKISRIAEGPRLLDNEAKAVADVFGKAGKTHYDRFIPTLAESFAVKDGITKRVNVFVHQPGFHSLEAVHARYPALDGRSIAWIFKRLLTAIGFAHRSGWVHGAVLPSHVLVQADTRTERGGHGLQLVGWGQAVKVGQTITSGSAAYLPWYPVEVRSKRAAGPSTDIYMAAKTILYLTGGDPTSTPVSAPTIPAEISRLLRTCLLDGPSMRLENAWQLLDDLTEVLQRVYGDPKYVDLIMA